MTDAREIPDDDEVWARVAWAIIATPGDRMVWQAIETFGASRALNEMWAGNNPARVRWLAEAMEVRPADVSALRQRYPQPPSAKAVSAVRAQARRQGLSLLSPGFGGWPVTLNDLGPYQPTVLFAQGEARILANAATLGVVGSRSPTPHGRASCAHLTREAIRVGYTIVSGGARGIDWVAHETATALGAPQVMVLATATDRLGSWQPDMVRRVARRGLVVSETPPGYPITPQSFLHRNRVIAALSERVVVVEAAERSGSLNTASHARALGRDLSAVVSRPLDDKNAGCYRLVDEWGADAYRETIGTTATRPRLS